MGIRTRPMREALGSRCRPCSCKGVLASLGTGSSMDTKGLHSRAFFGMIGQLDRQRSKRDESARYTQERQVPRGRLLQKAQRPIQIGRASRSKRVEISVGAV